jgi:hypothetical protein
MEKEILGLAGEFAVASELCRRGIYAQLTLGHRKRTDLLVYAEDGELLRIEVKAKRGRVWPNCKGVPSDRVALVFVDFAERDATERPDFYVLTAGDWRRLLRRKARRARARGKRVVLGKGNLLAWPDQATKSGKPYVGVSVTPRDITEHREAWDKIVGMVKGTRGM